MARFCVNKHAQPTGEHEVHNLDVGCGHLPALQNQRLLGNYPTCFEAIEKAKLFYSNVDGCAYCANGCHKG